MSPMVQDRVGGKIAPPVPRAERVRQIQAGVRAGLTHRQIAEMLGVSRSAIRNAINDPDGSKQRARRAGYVGECVDCGAETRSNGTSRPSLRCAPCARAEAIPPRMIDWTHASGDWPSSATVAYHHRTFHAAVEAAGLTYPGRTRTAWSADAIVAAIQQYAAEHGHPPKAMLLKGRTEDLPSYDDVLATFGGMAAAVEAAGIEPRRRRWSRESVAIAFRCWRADHGDWPTVSAWARNGDGHPASTTVYAYFDSWADAIAYAEASA